MEVVNAADLLSETNISKSIAYKHDDLHYDLGMLRADDAHPVDASALASDKEGYLQRLTQENTQLLVKHIFEQPIEQTQLGPVAVLPDMTTRLPRAKPVPKPKPLTRWEKFAKSKGITKKKKDRLVYDEATDAWVPKHGYGRIGTTSREAKREGKVETDWAYELRPGDDPNVDHIERKTLEKQQRVLKNKMNQLGNIDRAETASASRKGLALDAHASKALLAAPAEDPMQNASRKEAKKAAKLAVKASQRFGAAERGGAGEAAPLGKKRPVGIAPVPIREGNVDTPTFSAKGARLHAREDASAKVERLGLAQVSTASMGRFDRQVKGEPERPKDPRKLKRLPNEMGAKDEARRNADILRKVLGGSGEGESAGVKRKERGEGGGRGHEGDRGSGGDRGGKKKFKKR